MKKYIYDTDALGQQREFSCSGRKVVTPWGPWRRGPGLQASVTFMVCVTHAHHEDSVPGSAPPGWTFPRTSADSHVFSFLSEKPASLERCHCLVMALCFHSLDGAHAFLSPVSSPASRSSHASQPFTPLPTLRPGIETLEICVNTYSFNTKTFLGPSLSMIWLFSFLTTVVSSCQICSLRRGQFPIPFECDFLLCRWGYVVHTLHGDTNNTVRPCMQDVFSSTLASQDAQGQGPWRLAWSTVLK